MSDFLKNLKQSLDSGEKSDLVKEHFDALVSKAEELGNDPDQLEQIEAKAIEAQEKRKPLTPEEIKQLEFEAMKQQEKIDNFELEMNVQAALVNVDLALEKLEMKKQELNLLSSQLREPDLKSSIKKDLVKKILKTISDLEKTPTPSPQRVLADDFDPEKDD